MGGIQRKSSKKFIIALALLIALCGFSINSYAIDLGNWCGYSWKQSTVYVYIDKEKSAPQVPDSIINKCVDDIEDAVSTWNLSLENVGANVEYKFTSSESSADIRIEFDQIGNCVDNTYSGSTLLSSTVYIDDWKFWTHSISDSIRYNIILHEMGHTLGLGDISRTHAEEVGITSIMVNTIPSDENPGYITSYDRDILSRVY